MFAAASLVALALASSVFADPSPLTPPTGIEGQNCVISWTPDTTGTWTETVIELMTGANEDMVHLTTVTTVDTTSSAATSFTWICPQVTLHSAVYFYQLSHASNATDLVWTTRWGIAGADGQLTPPPNATQPVTNAAIPWGTGYLVDAADSTAAPTYIVGESDAPASGAAVATGNASVVASGSATGIIPAVSATGTGMQSVVTITQTTGSMASPTTSSTVKASTNGASSMKLQGSAVVAAGLFAAAFMAIA